MQILYNIVIQPIQYLIEMIYVLLYRLFGNQGYALIGLSIAVSTLVLPLYAQAERIQEKERKNQEKMKSWLTHIQKTFSGDERYMIQNAYYKEQGYKPFYALKGTLSLLLQIPFFLAAYQFLSHLKLLQGCAFGVIRDLGVEDGLITIGENHVNLLPVLMTLINFVSSTIYTRGFSIKEKLQPYLLAAVFLVLLYHSPSGLVLYWTMNNLYSLVKNMIMKVNWRRYRIDRIASVIVSMLLLVILYQNGTVARMVDGRKYEEIFQFLLVLLGFTCPLWMGLMKTKKMQTQAEEKNRWILPMETMICSLLLGVYIPLTVISSSPGDFVEVDRTHSPLSIMFSVLMVMIGFFLFWGNVIGAMIDRKKVVLYEGSLFSFIIVAMWNTFTYKPFTGRVSTFLKFEFILKSDIRDRLLNLVMVFIISIITWVLWKYCRKIANRMMIILLMTLLFMCGNSIYRTMGALKGIPKPVSDGRSHTIPLTTEGKNVIVLMLDRAIGAYVPFIFDEKPELKEQFDGFAFYPNTVSFGKHTNYGAPALFGGYDYTPAAMEQRTDMNLMEKHDEALKVMPVLFEESGGKVTIGKLPFIHYKRVMDVSFLSEYENIDVFDLNEKYAGIYETDEFWNQRIRNFCFYSLFKIAPVFLQDDVYDSGAYFTADWNSFMNEQEFLQSYASLKGLSELTDVTNTKENTLFIYDNETPHEPVILPLPDYDLTQAGGVFSEEMAEMREVDGITLRFDQEYQENSVGFYHVNMATMLTLGKWFDELRENGVYDNTRIILVADHGGESGQFDHLLFKGIDVEAVNPLLMVKDFDSHGFLVDNSFMTNADVPAIALSGLVETMKNPFTGNELAVDTENKAADIIWADDWDIDENNGIGFQPYDAPWYHVKGVISDPENWERVR